MTRTSNLGRGRVRYMLESSVPVDPAPQVLLDHIHEVAMVLGQPPAELRAEGAHAGIVRRKRVPARSHERVGVAA